MGGFINPQRLKVTYSATKVGSHTGDMLADMLRSSILCTLHTLLSTYEGIAVKKKT